MYEKVDSKWSGAKPKRIFKQPHRSKKPKVEAEQQNADDLNKGNGEDDGSAEQLMTLVPKR